MEGFLFAIGVIELLVALAIAIFCGVDEQATFKDFKVVLTVLISSGFGVIFLGELIELRNWFYSQLQNIKEAKSKISLYSRQKDDLETKLNELLEKAMEHESKLIDAVSSRDLSELKLLLESYPKLQTNETVVKLITQLTELRTNITNKETKYNECVRDYNTKAQQFPSNHLIPGDLEKAFDYIEEESVPAS